MLYNFSKHHKLAVKSNFELAVGMLSLSDLSQTMEISLQLKFLGLEKFPGLQGLIAASDILKIWSRSEISFALLA